ncbi:MAG: hypothetical protein ACKO2L_02355 [Planctomycetaceae bacterium]
MSMSVRSTSIGSFVMQDLGPHVTEVRFPQCSPEHLSLAREEVLAVLEETDGQELVLNTASMMSAMPTSAELARELQSRLRPQGRRLSACGSWLQRTSLGEDFREWAALF